MAWRWPGDKPLSEPIKWCNLIWITCEINLNRGRNLGYQWSVGNLSSHLVYFEMGFSLCSESHLFGRLMPRQNGRHFPDDIFKWIFLNENVWILINISLKFVPWGPIKNILTLVQVMAWRRPGDKPLSEPMLARLPMHICVTRPQWVKKIAYWLWGWSLSCVGHSTNFHFARQIYPETLDLTKTSSASPCQHARCHQSLDYIPHYNRDCKSGRHILWHCTNSLWCWWHGTKLDSDYTWAFKSPSGAVLTIAQRP